MVGGVRPVLVLVVLQEVVSAEVLVVVVIQVEVVVAQVSPVVIEVKQAAE